MSPAVRSTRRRLWAAVHRRAVLRGRGESDGRLDESIRYLTAKLRRQGVTPIELRAEMAEAEESAGRLRSLYDNRLEPNRPQKRVAYIAKQYVGTPRQPIVPDVLLMSLFLTGKDEDARELSAAATQIRDDATSWGYPLDREEQEQFEHFVDILLRKVTARLPGAYPQDFVIPWAARELGRLHKAIDKSAKRHSVDPPGRSRFTKEKVYDTSWIPRAEAAGDPVPEDYEAAVRKVTHKAPVIGMWAEAEKIDLGKLGLAEALEGVESYDPRAGEVPQGITVMTFNDGYTIQSLVEEDQLTVEGETMGHCVGGYCTDVYQGDVVIFSLRDPSGQPHVTIEWRTGDTALGRDVQLHPMDLLEPRTQGLRTLKEEGRFVQIRGKQNEMPAEKYRPYVQAFIDRYFDGDPIAKLMVAMPGQTINFPKGYVIRDLDVEDGWAWSGVPFHQGDYRGVTFLRGTIGDDQFDSVDFRGAKFINASVQNVFDSDFTGCKWEGSELVERFDDCIFVDCRFYARVAQDRRPRTISEIRSEGLSRCDFSGSEMDEVRIHAYMEQGSLSDVVIRDSFITSLVLRRTEVDGLTLSGEITWAPRSAYRGATFEGIDFTDVGDQTAMQLWNATSRLPSVFQSNKWPAQVLCDAEAISREECERRLAFEAAGMDPHQTLADMTSEQVARYVRFMEEYEG